jgi:GTP-binding protein YchF
MKSVGLLGLPQSGKSTVFDIILLGAGAAAGSSGSSRENLGVVRVPDARLDRLTELYRPKQTTHAQIQFVDTPAAPVVPGKPPRGIDLFAGVRHCDALALVLRDFDPEGNASAAADLKTLETELILGDLAVVEGRLERLEKELKVGQRQGERERVLLQRCREALEAERPLRNESFEPEEEKLLRGFHFLTGKPLLVIHNQGERAGTEPQAPGPAIETVVLKSALEREVLALPAAERERFRTELGIPEEALSIVIRACYRLMGLITFFTVGEREVRGWALRRGAPAVEAAGEIHSDMAKGFIRAEVVAWDRLLEAGAEKTARERGWLRLEGRNYEVQDGDCLNIRFNR